MLPLTYDVELGRGVTNVAAVACNASVAPRVLHAYIVNDQRAIGHLLEPGGATAATLRGGPGCPRYFGIYQLLYMEH